MTSNLHIMLHSLFKSNVINISTVSVNDCYFRGQSAALYSLSYSNRFILDSSMQIITILFVMSFYSTLFLFIALHISLLDSMMLTNF